MKKIILFFLLLMPMSVKAAEKFSIDCEQTVFKEFSNFACRLIVDSKVAFNKIEAVIEVTNGLSLEDVRTNHHNLWTVKTKNQLIIATTNNDRLVSGKQEFGILLFETMDSGKQTIKIKDITLSGEKTIDIDEVSETINVLSSENKLKGIFINGSSLPKFSSQVTFYNVEIEQEITAIQLDAIALNEMATIEGIGTIELDINQNEFVLPINVKSASGTNKVYVVTLKRKNVAKPSIIANNISIYNNDNLVNFVFDSYIYEYNIEVPDSVKSLEIKVDIPKDYSFVKKYGSRNVEIIDGDNLFLIKVKDKNGQVKTYSLNITRMLSNKSANCYLKSLEIKGYKLKFNKRVKKYELAIKKSTTSLNINAVTDHKNSIITILGNDNLKENSIVKVMVTAENGSKMTYQIAIKYKSFNYNLLIILAIILALLSILYDLNKKKHIFDKLKLPKFDIKVSKLVLNKKNNINKEVKKQSHILTEKTVDNKIETSSEKVINKPVPVIKTQNNVTKKKPTTSSNKVKKKVKKNSKSNSNKNKKNRNTKKR